MRTMQGTREVTVDRLRNRSKTFDQHFEGQYTLFFSGADGGTRTLKSVKTQASETCAYTNSATSARSRLINRDKRLPFLGRRVNFGDAANNVACFHVPLVHATKTVRRRSHGRQDDALNFFRGDVRVGGLVQEYRRRFVGNKCGNRSVRLVACGLVGALAGGFNGVVGFAAGELREVETRVRDL